MSFFRTTLWFGALSVALLATGISPASAQSVSAERAAELFGTPNVPTDLDPSLVQLGELLFSDPRLSSNGQVSCASCHDLAQGGDDGRALSQGVSGNPTGRNSPSVYNLVGHVAFFWDGRAASLEDQIDGPIHHPDEMDSDWEAIIERLRADANFTAQTLRDHRQAISADLIKGAIAEFERSLVTQDTPFDRFLAGNETALTPTQREGLDAFVNLGCASCHQGPLFGANLYQPLGIFETREGETASGDLFKVPSLRNVAVTGPYLHDGSIEQLDKMVALMGRLQLGLDLSARERAALVSFLDSLTDDRFRSSSTSVGSAAP